MKIQCISNRGVDLGELPDRPILGFDPNQKFSLVAGKKYVVYGITQYAGGIWYYISDEDGLSYPVWNPAILFTVVDGTLSQYWRVGMYSVGRKRMPIPIFAFPEWVNDPTFYDKLTDGDENAVATFKKYKILIDEESNRLPEMTDKINI